MPAVTLMRTQSVGWGTLPTRTLLTCGVLAPIVMSPPISLPARPMRATASPSGVSELQANRPTHGLGLAERAGQYVHQLWHAVFAIVLLRQQRAKLDSRRRAL